MAEETKESKAEEAKAAEEKTAAEGKSAENLKEENQAAEAKEKEIAVKAGEEEELTPAEIEHRDRSKLGRKIATMELNQTQMMDKIDAFISAAGTPKEPLAADTPLDVGTYKKLRAEEIAEKRTADNQYGKEYMKRIQEIAVDEDPDLHLQIEELIAGDDPKWNVKSNANAGTAATINYYKAKAHIQSGGKGTPLKLKKDTKLPPKSEASKTVEKTEPEVVLSEDQLEYIKKRGISPERYKKLMENKEPVYTSQGQVI